MKSSTLLSQIRPLRSWLTSVKLLCSLLFFMTSAFIVGDAFGQITLVTGSPQSNTSTTTTVIINRPTSLLAGDMMIATISFSETTGGTDLDAVVTSSGWTLVDSYFSGDIGGADEAGISILYKIATVADVTTANYTFTTDAASEDCMGSIVAFRGVNNANPFDVIGTFNATLSDDLLATSITTTYTNSAVFMAGLNSPDDDTENFSGWSTTNPGALTELFDVFFNVGQDMTLGGAWAPKPSAGATGIGVAEISGADNEFNVSILLALRYCAPIIVAPISGGASSVCVPNTTPAFTNTTPMGVWSTSNPAIATIDGSGVVTAVSNGTVDIIYTVTDVNGCSGSSFVSLTVGVPLQPSVISGAAGIAPNSMGLPYSVTNVSGVTYTWSFSPGGAGWSIATGQGTSSVTINSGTSFPQTLTVTPSNGCGNGTPRTLLIFDAECLPTYCTSCTTCSEPTDLNPILSGSCADLKIAFVIDESYSIFFPTNYVPEVESAVEAFVSTLSCTGAKLAVIEFNSGARYVTDTTNNIWYHTVNDALVTAIENYNDGVANALLLGNPEYDPQGDVAFTHWQAALLAVEHIPERPDLVIFFTDGVPTRVYLTNPPPTTPAGFGAEGSACGDNNAPQVAEYENASKVANLLKCAGVHMFIAGVGGIIGNETYIEQLSGPIEYENGINDISNADYATGNFDELAIGLAAFVNELCPFETEAEGQDVCPLGSNGSITVVIPGEFIPADWRLYIGNSGTSIQNGTANSSPLIITGLAPNSYRVEIDVEISGSCTRTEVFFVTITAGAVEVVASVTSTTNPTCANADAGTATLTITAGEAPFMIDLKKGGVSEPGYPLMGYMSTMHTAIGLDAGTYTFETKDVNNCNLDIDTFTLLPAIDCCPTTCMVTGGPGGNICPNTQSAFAVTTSGGTCNTPAYSWTIISNTSNATIVGSSTSASVTVSSGTSCGAYTIQSTVTCTGCTPLICTQVVNVVDTIVPVLAAAPANVTVECVADIPMMTNLSWTDNCDAGGSVAGVDGLLTGGPCGGTITRTWNVMDACGNAATPRTQIITVDDTTPPLIDDAAGDLDTTVDCSDAAGLAAALALAPTAMDNCDPSPTISMSSDITTPGAGCMQEYTRVRAWVYKDDCGNVSLSYTQTITVQDTMAPVILTELSGLDTTLDCSNLDGITFALTLMPTATDNCGPAPTISLTSDVQTAGVCPQAYTRVRTWRFRDACLNLSLPFSQTITVQDTTPPMIITIPFSMDTTLDCSDTAGLTAALNLMPMATDDCGSTPTISLSSDFEIPGSCPQEYTRVRVWGFRDSCLNLSLLFIQTITFQDTTAPVITCPVIPNDTIDCPAVPTFGMATATDDCDASVTITFADVTTPGVCPAVYSVTRTWTATDSCGNSSTCSATIFVQDTTAPVITCPVIANDTIDCSATSVFGMATATDACDAAVTITFADVTTPGTCPGEYSMTRTWTATDSCGNSSSCSATIFVQDTTAPVIICPVIANDTIDCPEVPTFGLATATDACDAAVTITFDDVTTPGGCPAEYSVTRTWTATDSCGNSSTCSVTIFVQDTMPPMLICPPNLTLECSDDTSPEGLGGMATATDNCGSVVLILNLNDVDLIEPCEPQQTQQFPQSYILHRGWLATDACGNTSTCIQEILVQDTTPPEITCPPDITIQCSDSTMPLGSDGTGIASATDNCNPNPTVTYNDTIIAGGCPEAYTIMRTWSATDGCDSLNISTCTQIITIIDTLPPVITCPVIANDTIYCPTVPIFGMATATDACDTSVTITFDDVTTPGACPAEYSVTRTWTATDSCGNSSTCSATIFVQDTTAPVITCPVISNDTIDCPAVPTFGLATATDACDAAVTITFADVTTPGACPAEYSVTRTWTATDSCGNSSTCSATIFVRDTTAPVITCPVIANDTIDCPAVPTFGLATATDACDAAVTITFADVTTPGSCPAEYTVTRTWTATDSCGNSSTCSATIFVQDTTAPVITCPVIPNDTINCPAVPTFGLATATDACDAMVTITFDDVTTPGSCPAEYAVTRTWTATDSCGNSSTCSATIFVQDTTAPVITCPVIANDTIDCPAVPTFGLATATDACDAAVTITFDDVTTPGACPAEYAVTRTWTATDSCGNSSTCSATIFVQDTTAPVITCPVIPNDTIDCPAVPTFGLATATDACDAAVTITFDDVTTPGACPAEYSVTRTWTATDSCGNSSTCSATIFVQDTTAPVITCPVIANDTIDCPAVPTFGMATATDACDAGVTITFDDVTTPGTCPAEYSVTRTWTATDSCGNSSTCSATIFIQDTTAPVITCPVIVNDTIDCPAVPTFGLATATDACDAAVTITFADVTTPGACPAEYAVTRTWTATDSCGNSSTCSATIFVQDTTAPVIICPVIANDTIDCPATPTFGLATATDACDAAVTLTFADVTTPGACPAEYSVTRTWTATDSCGNSSTCSATIFVQDTTAPVITCPVIANDTIDCPATPTFGLATATDACDVAVTITFADVSTPGACPAEYSVTRTWTATDSCGNSSTCSATIFVQDTTAPVITCPVIANDTIDCPAVPTFGLATATDACDAAVTITFDDATTPGACPAEYSVTRTWTATDSCGNSSTCSATIFVQDTTAPVITCPVIPNDTIDCPAVPTFGLATATDACDAAVTITFDDVTTPGSCPAEYSVTRTWTATDSCGNSSTCSATIFVQDTTAPVITCPVIVNDTIDCPAVPIFGMATATDACDAAVTITFDDVTTPGTCPAQYSVTRTWTATDSCGNSSTCSATIFVQDTTAPVITCPMDITIECTDDPSPDSTGFASATDNCDGTPVITWSDVTISGAGYCGAEYDITRTWTAQDECGNITTCVQTISIRDTVAPMCATQDITIMEVIDPDTGYVVLTPDMINNGSSDNCGGEVLLDISPDTLYCINEGINIVTLTVTDECGNTSTCTAQVTLDCIDPCVELVTWVYAEGAATHPNGVPNSYTIPMRTSLNNLKVLPGQTYVDLFFGTNNYTPPGQPFSGDPWFYPGTEGDMFDSGGDPMMGNAGYPATVVDWVLVSLRADSAGTGGPVCQAAALLHNDGHIEFVEEFDCCNIDVYASYYIVIEHRNHLIVMSADSLPVDLSNSTITYDFRIEQSYLDDPDGFGASAQKEIQPGVFAMFAGNGDQTTSPFEDTDINFNDRTFWEVENGDIGQYRKGDYNLNGDTNFNDRLTWERNNGAFTSVPRD